MSNAVTETDEMSLDRRHNRQLELIPPEKIHGVTAVVVGCGAIGSWLVQFLAHLGIRSMSLIDHDTVDADNLSLQGFTPDDLTRAKVVALKDKVAAIDETISVRTHAVRFNGALLSSMRRAANATYGEHSKFVVFSCVDDIDVREAIYKSLEITDKLFIDARMAGFSWKCFTVDSFPSPFYARSIFRPEDAYVPRCTEKGTVFAAAGPAVHMAAQLAMWIRGGRTSDGSLTRYIEAGYLMPNYDIDRTRGQG